MLEDMNPSDIIGKYKQVTLDLYNVGTRNVLYTTVETPYPEGKIIVSTTNTKGIITHVNHVFIEMSGYKKSELLGVNHSILRHPDMPSLIFKSLWDTIQTGKKWQGVIKNLRKDGGYYWVKVTVAPNIRKGLIVGYTSVRRKPSVSAVAEFMERYPVSNKGD
ncbi:MAG: PAS domain-containing protein [Methylococcales bacterium]|nr:PAS domain-containing protein [Methylococcales bacterium]